MSSMTADLSDIIPDEARFDVEGIPARMKPLRLMEALKLAKVIGTGLGAAAFGTDLDEDDIKNQVGAMLVLALPRAAAETAEFFAAIVEPVAKDDERRLRAKLLNPDLGTALTIVDLLLDREADNLKSLVGKALPLVDKITRLMLPEAGELDRSDDPSTSSQGSTDGPTDASND